MSVKTPSTTKKLIDLRRHLNTLAASENGVVVEVSYEDGSTDYAFGTIATTMSFETRGMQYCNIVVPDESFCSVVASLEHPNEDFDFIYEDGKVTIRRIDGAPFDSRVHDTPKMIREIVAKERRVYDGAE